MITVPLLFALIGSIILVGFLANLLFRFAKIPSVLLLIAIGVVLGPVTGWLQSESLLTIAPFFGAVALLVILFEGGLELEIGHVVRQAAPTAMFTVVVFGTSLVSASLVAYFALGLPVLESLMIGAILGATSPAIVMPVAAALSVRDDVKTVVKLESAMGEVLLIVTVVLLIQTREAGTTDAVAWVGGFVRSLAVALVVASIAGVAWSRLVGWLGREPLSYMLTLGVTCLLYFVVEELGGSPAIAVLMFGVLLANMQLIAGRFGPQFRELFGVNIREEQFVLGQFMVNITAELSFLVRTFFFVYLGLILDLSALSWTSGAWVVGIFALLLLSRRVGIALLKRTGAPFRDAEWQAIMSLQPRGLATAVVALLPVQAGIEAATAFPTIAFMVIVLSNLYMTGGIIFAERRLRGEKPSEPTVESTGTEDAEPTAALDEPALEPPGWPGTNRGSRRLPVFSPAREFEAEPAPVQATDWMARVLGMRLADREAEYIEAIRASYFSEPFFWLQAVVGASICALGLILGQTAIVIGGALVVPAARVVTATGLALASGDLYLLARLVAKLLAFTVVTMLVAAVLIEVLPFAVVTAEIATRTRPTILDFLVALFGGMSGATLVALRRRTVHYLPGAVIALTLLPALCVMGFAVTDKVGTAVLQGAALQFSANLFAAVLGAGGILAAVGISSAAQAATIRQWKDEELAAPLPRAVFSRMGLDRVIGRTGSVRARVMVVGVFLLVLLIPLQLALNQVSAEFRARQAITEAQEAFNVPNRSSLIGSSVVLAEDLVDVRLQVATSELFDAADVRRFEERVSAQVGRRAHLDLVQTVADVGSAGTLRRLLEADGRAPAPVRTVFDALQDTSNRVRVALEGVPLPGGVEVVDIHGGIASAAGPTLTLVYLAERELSSDARDVLARLLAAQMRLDAANISMAWVPAVLPIRVRSNGSLVTEDTAVLEQARTSLTSHANLRVGLALPPGVADRIGGMIAERVRGGLGLTDLPLEPAGDDARRNTALLHFRVQR